MPVWNAYPGDNSELAIDIVPQSFFDDGEFCVKCGGATDIEWICTRCGADHWPAVQRHRKARRSGA